MRILTHTHNIASGLLCKHVTSGGVNTLSLHPKQRGGVDTTYSGKIEKIHTFDQAVSLNIHTLLCFWTVGAGKHRYGGARWDESRCYGSRSPFCEKVGCKHCDSCVILNYAEDFSVRTEFFSLSKTEGNTCGRQAFSSICFRACETLCPSLTRHQLIYGLVLWLVLTWQKQHSAIF